MLGGEQHLAGDERLTKSLITRLAGLRFDTFSCQVYVHAHDGKRYLPLCTQRLAVLHPFIRMGAQTVMHVDRAQRHIRLLFTPAHQLMQQYGGIEPTAEPHQQLAMRFKELCKGGNCHGDRSKGRCRYVTGHLPQRQMLLLVKFQRQTVGIVKEREAFAGKGIDTHRFALHLMRFQMGDSRIDVIHAERQVA